MGKGFFTEGPLHDKFDFLVEFQGKVSLLKVHGVARLILVLFALKDHYNHLHSRNHVGN